MNNRILRRRSHQRLLGLFVLPAVVGIGDGRLLPPPQELALADLGFMTGCWQGTFESRGQQGVIEERYTSPSQNVMLGTTQYLVGERTVQFEMTTILLGDSGIVMTPYPGGRASDDGFTLTTVSGGEAIFEAPEHDFPKRIIYRAVADALIARIDDVLRPRQTIPTKVVYNTTKPTATTPNDNHRSLFTSSVMFWMEMRIWAATHDRLDGRTR